MFSNGLYDLQIYPEEGQTEETVAFKWKMIDSDDSNQLKIKLDFDFPEKISTASQSAPNVLQIHIKNQQDIQAKTPDRVDEYKFSIIVPTQSANTDAIESLPDSTYVESLGESMGKIGIVLLILSLLYSHFNTRCLYELLIQLQTFQILVTHMTFEL